MGQFIPVPGIEGLVARSAPVSLDIRTRGVRALAAAKAKLAFRRAEGHSRVTGRKEAEDYLLYLDDTRGLLAAHIIEFGLRPSAKRPAGQVPVRAITGPQVRKAAGGQTSA